MAEDTQVAQLSFEDALKELERIVTQLESGDVPLDRAIDLYQQGDALRRQCAERLERAQMRIEAVRAGADGQPTGTQPFNAG
ncbi:exodeoxyribonuclease VII small subunit [Sphingomonas sp. BGYR3]|uniref:exodeoxyribonuclease VII small subunit n=1 Tax=Sphingomonas sp. BGYR3 TaxID=2975483 RepID=UPI0021A8D8BD|nr:exodeoxyribonuclease VII small subunit [Sphingomonas sp. BGYR3]MDG5488027.1 exodeoxyribonuclease VII small subunit [Sphingomonas sp. BGYR3]